jgi:hypothetical protein
MEVYRYEESMHKACSTLYIAVLKAFSYIIKWFHQSTPSRLVKISFGHM